MNHLISIILSFLVCSAAAEEPAVGTAPITKPYYVMCKNKNVVRTIRIEKSGSSCKAIYTKEGMDSVVGRSSTEEICRDIFDKIKINLEKANWKCKDITQSRVSNSEVH